MKVTVKFFSILFNLLAWIGMFYGLYNLILFKMVKIYSISSGVLLQNGLSSTFYSILGVVLSVLLAISIGFSKNIYFKKSSILIFVLLLCVFAFGNWIYFEIKMN